MIETQFGGGLQKMARRQALAGLAASTGTLLWRGKARAGVPKWRTLPQARGLPAPARSGLAAVNGTSIFFAQYGSGAPVLLLHGGLGSSTHWGYQIGALSANYLVTVMDTRGHGRSPLPAKAFHYAQFAEDAAGLLDYLNIKAAAVIGWSDGGVTGLALAAANPERVSKLFAFGANASLDGMKPGGAKTPTFAAYAARCRAEYRKLSPQPEKWPDLVARLRAMWRSEPNFTKRDLAAISVPTVIADGEYDEIIRRDHTESMAHAIPHARLAILPGVSHFAMMQDPALFNRELSDFLAG
jgi:pimeloyl-ACP methyl ester carboxylesterase